MLKITVTNDQALTEQQYQRLDSLGEVTYYTEPPTSGEEYLERIRGADIVCSGMSGLKDAYTQVRDVYITVGFVSVAFVDLEVLTKNNVKISNAPGANRHAVSEWVLSMIIMLMRDLPNAINREESYRLDGKLPPTQMGLAGNKITVLGKGNVGRLVGELAAAFGMHVTFFGRGDDLHASVADADVVVDTLSSNASTVKLLNAAFFEAMKEGSAFVTVTRAEVVDEDAMLAALDSGKLRGVAHDCGGILVGDTTDLLYQKLRAHPKVIVTPHISYSTQMSVQTGNDIMINNIEAWIRGEPQNLLN